MSAYRWKGKLVKKKTYDTLIQRTKNGKNRKKVHKETFKNAIEDNVSSTSTNRNKIIDLEYMKKNMFCSCCKEPLLMQNIEDDTTKGLATVFKVRCQHCLLVNTINSGEEYQNPTTGKKVFTLNIKAALGTMHAGLGQTHLNKLFTVLDLPTVNSHIYKMHERIIGPIVECIAKKSCSEAAAMERVLTIENIEELRKSFAKAMEADAAVQLVTNSQILKNANVEVGVFIGDNDSCCIASIQDRSKHNIIKQSDMNHSTKGVGNMLHNIHNDKSSDLDKELSNVVIKHIQHCFIYAIHQNKGDVVKIIAALQNIPYHLFNDHGNCAVWCKDDIDKENFVGIRLKNGILFEVLKKTFLSLSENAQKFVTAASSQSNESLNNSMYGKARKGISYSTTKSADFRFAATIAEKNCGTDYLHRSMAAASMSWSNNLNNRIKTYDKICLRKKQKSSLPSFKKNRLNLKAKRSQLRHQKENAEGQTYKSSMGLLDQSITVDVEDCIQVVTDDAANYDTEECAIVFFDLETGGLSLIDDILQISMKCGRYVFDSFITPTRSINYAATKANGLSNVHKKLFKNGQEVGTLSRRIVFGKVLEYLKSLNKRCILAAHNCIFDSTRFILAIKELSLLEEYEKIIEGFSDTLSLFRQKFPKEKMDIN